MNQRSLACKGLVLGMVLFSAYMQGSPVVDLDYVWINGSEHYVGAVSPHRTETGTMVLAPLPPAVGAFGDDVRPPRPRLPLLSIESTGPGVPLATLRLRLRL